MCKSFKEKLKENGIETNVVKHPTGLYPECYCLMHNVEKVEGYFFKVEQHQSNGQVKYQVILLGSVGGPYENVHQCKFD